MRKIFLVFIIIIMISSSANSQIITLDSISGGNLSTMEIYSNQKVTFYLRITNETPLVQYIVNAFRVYSPDNVNWITIAGDTLDIGQNWYEKDDPGSLFDNYFAITVASADGYAADSVGFVGIGLTGLPVGFNELSYSIEIGPISDLYVGGRIVLDSSFMYNAYYWEWGDYNSNEIYPTWGGPYEFTVAPCIGDGIDTDGDGFNDFCYTGWTYLGTDVYVDLSENLSINYGNVDSQGYTSLSVEETGHPTADNFKIHQQTKPLYYNLSTTATFTDDITICIKYEQEGTPIIENHLMFMSWQEQLLEWRDIKLSIDTVNNIICGLDSDLSQYLVAYPYGCCQGYYRGNADNSPGGIVDIDDLVFLVDYAFGFPPGPTPECMDEADVDGNNVIDIDDILVYIDYGFGFPPGPAPATCP